MRIRMLRLATVLVAVMAFANSGSAQAQRRVIRAPGADAPVVLWPGSFLWDSTSGPSALLDAAKLAYVQGFWDAITLMDAKAQAIPQLSKQYDGMTIDQVVATMDKFYHDNPQWRDYKPAFVLVAILPRIRQGLPPLPPDTVRGPAKKAPVQ